MNNYLTFNAQQHHRKHTYFTKNKLNKKLHRSLNSTLPTHQPQIEVHHGTFIKRMSDQLHRIRRNNQLRNRNNLNEYNDRNIFPVDFKNNGCHQILNQTIISFSNQKKSILSKQFNFNHKKQLRMLPIFTPRNTTQFFNKKSSEFYSIKNQLPKNISQCKESDKKPLQMTLNGLKKSIIAKQQSHLIVHPISNQQKTTHIKQKSILPKMTEQIHKHGNRIRYKPIINQQELNHCFSPWKIRKQSQPITGQQFDDNLNKNIQIDD